MLELSKEGLVELVNRYNPNFTRANCMSFALDITEDYRYNICDKIREHLPGWYSDDDEELESEILDFITTYCKNLVGERVRSIERESEVQDNEYLVMFRFDLNYLEFHFVRVYQNIRLEKNGDYAVSQISNDIDLYEPWEWDEDEAELLLCSNQVKLLAVKPSITESEISSFI